MKLEPRTTSGSKVRLQGLTPGVLYGKGIKTVPVQALTSEFQKMYLKNGKTKTFEVTFKGKKHIVYIKAVQSFPEDHFTKTHFDLVKVAKDDTMTSKVNLVFTNHKEVERRGLLVQAVMNYIEVEYEVGSGISKIELDVEGLNDHDTLRVKDIVAPEGIKILDDPEEVVVSISTPKEEKEVTEEDEVEAEE